MKMFKYLLACFAVAAVAGDESGFINIDCGASESHYIDQVTGLNYTSDAGFIDRGQSVTVSLLPSDNPDYPKQFFSARSFPEGIRNCYTLRPGNGGEKNKYIIRAFFLYGNYDNKSQAPQFDVYIGEDIWTSMIIPGDYIVTVAEIIHSPTTAYVHVCLQKTGTTTPFISAIELRPLNNTLYQTQSGSLMTLMRYGFGLTANRLRYPDDVYDRIWERAPPNDGSSTLRSLSTSLPVTENQFRVPSSVMRTAATILNTSRNSLSFPLPPISPADQIFYLHFAEVEDLKAINQSREIQVYLNREKFDREFSPPYLQTLTIFGSRPLPAQTRSYDLTINSTKTSTRPPIINAMEIYELKNFNNVGTDDSNVAAIFDIKSYYGLTRNWSGDPCRPQAFTWEGLKCDYEDNISTIISLNLSSSQLTGSIAPRIANLTSIQILDLSNNSLKGSVPDFLAELQNLAVLHLAGNNFSGAIPAKILDKAKQGSLSFSIHELPMANNIGTPRKSNKGVPPTVAIASGVATSVVILCVIIFVWIARTRKRRAIKASKNNGSFKMKAREVTYSEILEITNNFEKVLGKGGFGTVYHGFMGDTEVAVKMLSPSSKQGYKEFRVEVDLLMNIHHKNLTFFVGYCNEGSYLGIIYEYMINGSLKQHLTELSFEQRLRIAVDAAQGLQYLHQGCKPPIIHRDVKPANILLTHNFQAKLSDFGLSRVFVSEDSSDVSIKTIAGTPGYLDPECYSSFKFTEKNDVYSFGIVLLEIITGRPVVDSKHENRHITDWVFPLLEQRDMSLIIDERFDSNFNIQSAWKIVELAMRCVSQPSTKRPTMYDIVSELKECLAIETCNTEEIESTSMAWSAVDSDYDFLAR